MDQPPSICLRGKFHEGVYLQTNMENEALRLMSYLGYQIICISSLKLASNGFYVTGFSADIRCFSCGKRHLGQWLKSSPDIVSHKEGCLHQQGRDPRNVPFAKGLRALGAICPQNKIISMQCADTNEYLGMKGPKDGHHLYVLENYSPKKAASMKDDLCYFQSPSFYSSPTGYKMAVRIYLNGKKHDGSGHFVAIFLVILKGENDSFLSWPFCMRVSIHVINQAGMQNCGESFLPTDFSSNLQRPETENVIFQSGYQIDHQHLENADNGYIVNDRILINIRVND